MKGYKMSNDLEDINNQLQQLEEAREQILLQKKDKIIDHARKTFEEIVAASTPAFDEPKLQDKQFILEYFKSTQDAKTWLGHAAYKSIVKTMQSLWDDLDQCNMTQDLPDISVPCLKPFCLSVWSWSSSSWVEIGIAGPVSSNGYHFIEVSREQLDRERRNIVFAFVKKDNDCTVVDRQVAGAYCYIQTSGHNDSYGETSQNTIEDAKVVEPVQITQIVFK